MSARPLGLLEKLVIARSDTRSMPLTCLPNTGRDQVTCSVTWLELDRYDDMSNLPWS